MRCLLCERQIVHHYLLRELLFKRTFYADQICAHCLTQFQRIEVALACRQCGCQLTKPGLCHDCQVYQRTETSPLKNQSLFQYNQAMHDYFQAYKRHGDYQLRLLFAGSLQQALQKYRHDYSFVYIPTSLQHFQQRQFDPVMGLYADLCPLAPLLKRNAVDWHQSELKRAERLLAPQTFVANFSGQRIKPKILLLDDIYTTGTTLRRGATALRSGGYTGEIESFTLAR